MNDIYEELKEKPTFEIKQRTDLKRIYFDFLEDFKNYLTEFVKESAIDLEISNIEVSTTPTKLFAGAMGGIHVVLKNQGERECYLTTDRKGAYRLDPDEKEKFWLNAETLVVTLSGTTTLGFIRT